MRQHQVLSVLLLTAISAGSLDAFDPCQGKSGIGGPCDRNFDCTGFGVTCKGGKCDCHHNYEVRQDGDGSKYCAKLPDAIGAPCSNLCRFPMFCSNGQCQCVRATKAGNACYPNAQLGDSCKQDAECTLPFSACIGGRCSCIPGTTASKGQCAAARHCPDGARSGGNCVRLTYDRSGVENHLSNKGADTCPDNQYCYTSDHSLGGHCCPITCPHSTQPNLAFSCVPGAANACPLDTHYCHRLAGQAFSISACCRRACKEPTPLYVNGKCYARAWLGGPCTVNEQCDAGDAMQCSSGQCVCKSGFSPLSGSYITSENPPQICVRSCSDVSRGGECFSSADLGGQCDVDDQCPTNGKCLRGQCTCDCNAGYTRSGGSCGKSQPTTAAPGSAGVTNSGGGGFLGLVGGLLKGAGGGSGGSGGLGGLFGR